MKRVLLVAGLLAHAASASAQSSNRQLLQGDIAGAIGWAHLNTSELDSYEDWHNRGFFGDLTFGWYWTDHAKTEVHAGAGNQFTVFTAGPVEIGGQRLNASSLYTFEAQRFGLTQQHQFGRYQWFHPFIGAGVELVRERITREDSAVYAFDPVSRRSRVFREAMAHPVRVELRTRALASVGFKSYMHPRVFFLVNGRVTFGRRPEHVAVRFGLGVDF